MEVLDIISVIVALVCLICLLVCGVYGFIVSIKAARAERLQRKIVLEQLNETLKSAKLLADKRIEVINAYNDIDPNK